MHLDLNLVLTIGKYWLKNVITGLACVPECRAPAVDSIVPWYVLALYIHGSHHEDLGTRQAALGTFTQITVKLMPPEDFT